MSNERILVVGGTGDIGQVVAQQLKSDGYKVRVFTRNVTKAKALFGADFEYAEGDVTDADSVARALKDCAGVFVSLQSGQSPQEMERVQHQGTATIARQAVKRGLKHLVYLSGYLVSEEFAHIPAERAKLMAERAIQKSGISYTIFKPTYFIDILPRFVQGKRATLMGSQPHPVRMLAVEDFARMVSKAFRLPEAARRTFFVCGPEPITFKRALELYCEAVQPQARVSTSPFWLLKLLNRLVMKNQLTEIIQLMEATEKVGEIGDPAEANRIFGAPAITVQEWCQRQKVNSEYAAMAA